MSFELKKLSDKISVTGQIMVADIANIKAQGFSTIINNRFDGKTKDNLLRRAFARLQNKLG